MIGWSEHVARWRDCTKCPLHCQRDNIVLARAGVAGGDPKGASLPATVLFVGEAPGASEDATGLPFWGPAGDLLQQIVDLALPTGTTYAMTNLVACFPREAKARGDNEPEGAEIRACRPRLVEFVNIAQPRLIVCVGSLATEYVDHKDNIECVDIVHPAFILARLPRAQREMAVNKSVVVVRRALQDVLQSEHKQFIRWGDRYANFSAADGLRQRFDAWEGNPELDVPF